MLTSPQPDRKRTRPAHSLKQEYEEFILQRIEEFKDQLSREQLLAIADEAVRELELSQEEQLVLTEVLVLEHVDRLIMRRLNLPRYRKWRERHLKLRRAQREPTHWGLESDTPLADLAQRMEEDDLAVVVGAGAAPAALYLAAHDAAVLLIDQELAAVEAAESRAVTEAVAARFQALVVRLGVWFPDVAPALTVLDPFTLSTIDASTRVQVVEALKHQTPTGGIHCIMPAESRSGVIALAPEAMQAHYGGWIIDRARRGSRSRWFMAVKP